MKLRCTSLTHQVAHSTVTLAPLFAISLPVSRHLIPLLNAVVWLLHLVSLPSRLVSFAFGHQGLIGGTSLVELHITWWVVLRIFSMEPRLMRARPVRFLARQGH